ncbi:MAG: hypothetical protein FWD56_01255 [Bacteroidales bacterium]|nr:hypothetical protein [Bacteroidales bacterium]
MNIIKSFLCISLCLTWLNPSFAQQRAIERIHISTDRELYVAGETIWLSLYCFDMSGKEPHLSHVSSVAYLELRQDASLLASVKLAITTGRGSGRLQIPPALPTGNYRLIAYTKQMMNEDTLRYFDKIIPIYNTLSAERVPENVFMIDEHHVDEKDTPVMNHPKLVDLQLLGVAGNSVPPNFPLPISIKNISDQAISINISVANIDIPAKHHQTIPDFFVQATHDPAKIKFQDRYIPEYEGEIIRGVIKNIDAIHPKEGSLFLSTIGTGVEVYAASLDTITGDFSFYTHSIYGNREIALEYSTADEVSFELIDPFVKPPVMPSPPLYLDKKTESAFVQRSIEMQVSHRFGMDTLYNRISTLGDPFISNNKPIVYDLDHYTRFPAMQDIMVEFISEMRFKRNNNRMSLEMVLLDAAQRWAFYDNPLTVIDGIAIFDHERLYHYDPLKVKTVTIYRSNYRIGNKIFNGIAQFNTYHGGYPGLTLGKNALILDFPGVAYPCRFTGIIPASVPDVRTLLYWDPLVEMARGEGCEIVLKTSLIPGTYAVTLEGVTDRAQPVYHKTVFTVQ